MNIGEANDLNVVLRYVLNLRGTLGVTPTDEQAREAAERLTDKANKALGAGLTAEQVTAAWPDLLLDNGDPDREEGDYSPEVAARLAAVMYGDDDGRCEHGYYRTGGTGTCPMPREEHRS